MKADLMQISISLRPASPSAQERPGNAIDDLLTAYRTNMAARQANPAGELVSWIRDGIESDSLREVFSEQDESVRAALFEELISVCIDENLDDREVWSEILGIWWKVPEHGRESLLGRIAPNLDARKPEHEPLWLWLWQKGEWINPPDNRSAFLLDVANSLVTNEQYGLLDKIIRTDLETVAGSGSYLSPSQHPLKLSGIGQFFWPALLDALKQIPKHDASWLAVLKNTGVLLSELKIEDGATWKSYAGMLIETPALTNEDIAEFVQICSRGIQDPRFWTWMIGKLPPLEVGEQVRIGCKIANAMGTNKVKDNEAWSTLLSVLAAVPAESADSPETRQLLGSIIGNMGKVLITSPILWNSVMDRISVHATSLHSTGTWGLEELSSQMYKAKITSQALSFRLIKLHATALFQDLQKNSDVNYAAVRKEVEASKDVSSLVQKLLTVCLPAQDKRRLLEQISRSMSHAVDDAGLWALLITQQVLPISDEPPCPDFVALKYHVADLCSFYGKSNETFDQMLQSAIRTGRWNLDDMERVRQDRKEIREAAAHVPWEKIFDPDKRLKRRGFCTFPELASVSQALVESIQGVTALVKRLPGEERRPFQPLTLLNGTLTTRLQQGKGDKADARMNREVLTSLVKVSKDQASAHDAVADAVTLLNTLGSRNDALKSACEQVQKCFQDLIQLTQAPGFADRYSYCDFYTCEVLDKEAASALVLGNAVSCCLATDGGSFAPEMVNRLTHPGWMPIVVRDYKNDYVAAAWCALANDAGSDQLYLVEDFADIAPRFSQKEMVDGLEIENRSGNCLMKAIHEHIGDLSLHLGLQTKPLIGKQARGRMENFDVFAKSPEAYFVKPRLKFLCNEASTGDNIQHPGVVGQFF